MLRGKILVMTGLATGGSENVSTGFSNNNMDVGVGCPYRQDKLPDGNMSALTSLVCQVGLTVLP